MISSSPLAAVWAQAGAEPVGREEDVGFLIGAAVFVVLAVILWLAGRGVFRRGPRPT